MEALNDIITELTTIAQDKKYEGPTVDAMIYLMANGIYRNNLNAVNAVLEASQKRCKLLNSAIQHAQDGGYSVNRGMNQHIFISNYLTTTPDKSHKKYDPAYKVDGLTLFWAKDGDLSGGEDGTLELIVGEKQVNETIVGANASTILSLRTLITNISQDVSLYMVAKTEEEEDALLTYTEVRHQLLEHLYTQTPNEDIYWLLTTTDYGIEFYKFLNNPLGSTDPSAELKRFINQDTYLVKGVEYTTKSIADPSKSIKTFPGIKIGSSTVITWTKPVARLDDISEIYVNTLKAKNSDFMLRTTDDMQRGVLAVNDTNLSSCYLKYYATKQAYLADFPTEDPDEVDCPCTCVFYLTATYKPNGEPDDLDDNAQDRIRNKLLTVYYVDNNIRFKKGVQKVISGTGGAVDSKYKITLDIVYNSILDPGISQYIHDNYSKILGQQWDPYRIQTDINNTFSGIYSIMIDQEHTTMPDSSNPNNTVKPWEYIDLDVQINTRAASMY